VSELFRTATANAADVVLPAQAFTEREGSFTSGERRVQRFYPAVPAMGHSRADWQIFSQLGERVGQGQARPGAAAVMTEISKAVPDYSGVTYQAMAKVEKQFPDVGGTDLYYGGTAYQNNAGLGVQYPSAADRGEPVAVAEVASVAHRVGGLVAAPITVLYDRGTTFIRSYVMHPRIPRPYIVINPADAAALGIADGETIVLSVNGKELSAAARVDGHAPAGALLAPQSLGSPALVGLTPAAAHKLEKVEA
ncbi:MAG: molybdopterin-dependent oxidoreductase, partial [Chloroflexi bacterium]|nr:molybdopterin-dependent oxidoreductase [Chloroflexota bacterium]